MDSTLSTTANPRHLSSLKDQSEEMQACLEACLNCAISCETTMQKCLEMGGAHADPIHIRRLQDCAQLCLLHVSFMSRGSDTVALVAEACGHACTTCAVDCERFQDSEFMMACAAQCNTAADHCRKMSTPH